MAFISSQNGEGSVVTQRTNDAVTSNQPTLKATVASVDPDILQIPIPPNETLRQKWRRILLTSPILTLELSYDLYMSPIPCPFPRSLPSLLTALFRPDLILPQDVVPIDMDFLLDYKYSSIDVIAQATLKSKEYGTCYKTTVSYYEPRLPGQGEPLNPTRNRCLDDPLCHAIMCIASDESEKKRAIAEYRTYYELLRSGHFNLDLFTTLQYIASGEQLPPQFIYPDAIAWPYGLFQDLVDETCVYGLLLPNFRQTLRAYHSMIGPGSLPRRAKNALFATLKKLHRSGYIHGNINKDTIIVDMNLAVFTSFEYAEKCDDELLKQEEMQTLWGVIG